jgi:hypothetical protein
LGLRSGSSGTRQFDVLPLFLKDEQLGYCLIQAKGGKGALHEALRDHLSVALYGSRLAESKRP